MVKWLQHMAYSNECNTKPISYTDYFRSEANNQPNANWFEALVAPIVHWAQEMKRKAMRPTIKGTIIQSGQDPKGLGLWISTSENHTEGMLIEGLQDVNQTLNLLQLQGTYHWKIVDNNENELGSGTDIFHQKS